VFLNLIQKFYNYLFKKIASCDKIASRLKMTFNYELSIFIRIYSNIKNDWRFQGTNFVNPQKIDHHFCVYLL